MGVMHRDLAGMKRAAFISTEEDGRARWTELAVWFDLGASKPWIAEARGCSRVAGERTKVRRLESANLERALGLFDESDVGIIVKTNAREWAEDEGLPQSPPRFTPKDDREALAILMGCAVNELSVNAAAKALGIGESSVRMALKDGRDLRIPLRALFPFVDRAAFQRARNMKDVDHG